MQYDQLISDLVNTHDNPEQLFDILYPVGDGSFGVVYKARERKTGTLCAIKMIYLNDKSTLEGCLKEIQIMSSCNSHYIVSYIGTYHHDSHLWIVMEYCEFGSLKRIMNKHGRPLSEKTIGAIVYCILKGIAYIHSRKLIHRDIKADNILIGNDGVAKISDFGVSTKLLSTFGCTNSVSGSPYWMSPESLQNENYTSKTDIWSLGITSIELAEGVPPYQDKLPYMVMELIKRKPAQSLSEPKRFSEAFQNFVKLCLTIDPDERPTAQDLFGHPFVLTGEQNQHLLSEFVLELRSFFDPASIPNGQNVFEASVPINSKFFARDNKANSICSQEEITEDRICRRSIRKSNERQNGANKAFQKQLAPQVVSPKPAAFPLNDENTGTIIIHKPEGQKSGNIVQRLISGQSPPQALSVDNQIDTSIIEHKIEDLPETVEELLKVFAVKAKELDKLQAEYKLGFEGFPTEIAISTKVSTIEQNRNIELSNVNKRYDQHLKELRNYAVNWEVANNIYKELRSKEVSPERIKKALFLDNKISSKKLSKPNINTGSYFAPSTQRIPTSNGVNFAIPKATIPRKEGPKVSIKRQVPAHNFRNSKPTISHQTTKVTDKLHELKNLHTESSAPIYSKPKSTKNVNTTPSEQVLHSSNTAIKSRTNFNVWKLANYLK